jgi:RimJ/RimL family protein N-acetyltransferase
MKPLIRKLRPSDLAVAVEIHTDPQTNTYNPFPPGKAEVEEFFAHWLQLTRSGEQAYKVVEIDGKVAGFGGAVARYDDLCSENYFNIYFRLGVKYQGMGLGILLGKEGLRAASMAGMAAMAVTRLNNYPSIRLISRLGMQPHMCRVSDHGAPQLVYRTES